MEALEDRAVPALLLSGASTTLEGANYVLSLEDTDNAGVTGYAINWGDGSAIETVAAAQVPGVFTHLYADGPLNATISVQSIVESSGPSPDAAFYFDDNFDNAVEGGEPLVAITNPNHPSGFEEDSTGDTVYRFSMLSGLSWSTVDVLDSSSDYTIEMSFRYDQALTAWRKFLDFDNRALDSGLYVFHTGPELSHPDVVQIFPNGLSSGPFPVQEWWHVTLSRSAATNQVVLYVEGAMAFSFHDHSGDLAVGEDNQLHFFLDDAQSGGGESGSGAVSRIRIFDEALTGAQVTALYNNTGGSSAGASASLPVQVLNVNPIYTAPADQSGRPASFDLGSFTDAGLLDGPWSVIVAWGDGSSDSFDVAEQGALSRAHHYAKNGKYAVTVTVTDKDGGVASGSFQVHLKGNPKGPASAIQAAGNLLSGPGNSGAQIDWNSLAAHVFGGKK